MKSDAMTVSDYLAELPDDRAAAISAVRNTILDKLPSGFEESMNWGMICYEVPLSVCPNTYNGQPLMYAALASQKRHMAVYLMGMYCDAELNRRITTTWKKRGTRLNMGKSCIRFTQLEQLELELVGEVISAYTLEKFIELQNQARGKT
jgi:hypothetical protein